MTDQDYEPRTWNFRGVDWPYDEATSREIDERVAAAKAKELEQMTDLEWYDFIQGEEETDEEVDPR